MPQCGITSSKTPHHPSIFKQVQPSQEPILPPRPFQLYINPSVSIHMPLRKRRPSQEETTTKMGLFSKKDKHASQALANPSTANHSSKPSNVSNTDQSYRDSTYYSNSNHSSTESRPQTTEPSRNTVPQQRNDNGQAPGTTVTTTTTTTTS